MEKFPTPKGISSPQEFEDAEILVPVTDQIDNIEHINPVLDLEVRKFTKENALSFRNALAQVLWARRKSYRDVRPATREQLTAEYENLKASLEVDIEVLERGLQEARQALSEREQEKEIWDEVNREAKELRMELDKINSSLWHRALNYIDGRIDKKNQVYQELNTQINGEIDISTYNYVSNGLPRTEEVDVMIAQENVATAETGLVVTGSYLENNLESAHEEFIKEMRDYIHDEDWVEKSKAMVKEFYKRNSDLKESIDAEPELRDVTELSKQHGVLFVHGIPLDGMMAENNNNHVVNNHAIGNGRLNLLAAISPAISCSTFKPNFTGEIREVDQRLWKGFGVIVAGGVAANAFPRDDATVAVSFDSRVSKYVVKPGWTSVGQRVSDFQDNETFTDSINESIHGRAVQQVGYHEERDSSHLKQLKVDYNEIVVKQPKITALYVRGSELVRDNHSEYGQTAAYEGVDNRYLRSMLEMAQKLGVPLIYIDVNDNMINVVTGEEVNSVEELVDSPVSFSPEERFSLLDQAGIDFQGKQLNEVTNRIENFSTSDQETKHIKEQITAAIDQKIKDLNL